MAITVQTTGNAVTTGSRSPAITFAAWTPRADDRVLFFAASAATAAAATGSVDWILPTPASGLNPVVSDVHSYVFAYHTVTEAEQTAVTMTYTATNLWNTTQTGNVTGIVLRGTDQSFIIDSLVSTFDTAAATPHILPALTGSNLSTNSMVVRAVAKDGTGTWTTPASHTARGTNNTNQGNALYTMDTLTTAGNNVAATNITPNAGDEYCSFSVALTVIEKIDTIVDNMNAGLAGWNTTNPGISADMGGARITHSAAAGQYILMFKNVEGFADLTDSAAYVQVREYGNQALTSHYVSLSLNHAGGTVDKLLYIAGNNVLGAYRILAGAFAAVGSTVTLNSVLHRWLKIRETAGTVFFETSPDGFTWSTLASTATPFPVTTMQTVLECSANSAEASGTSALFDNFNTVPAYSDYRPLTVAVNRANFY